MLMSVISVKEQEIELIGVVPRVDTIENATPNDIINNPTTNEQILLIILYYLYNLFLKSKGLAIGHHAQAHDII